MPETNCKTCKVLLDNINRASGRNVCTPCYYKQQKDINEKRKQIITEKKCTRCNLLLSSSKFCNISRSQCVKCTEETDIEQQKQCSKCDVLLTSENKSYGKKQCKPCINKAKRERRASAKIKE